MLKILHFINFIVKRTTSERTCLFVAKLHLYCRGAVGEKRGVYSYVVLDAEFNSGVKIKILSLFDPQNPLFGSKSDPNLIIFLFTQLVCM